MRVWVIVRDRGGQRDWLSSYRDGWTDDLAEADQFDDRDDAQLMADQWADYSAVRGFGYEFFPQEFHISEIEALG